MPYVSTLCYYDSLVTRTVVSLTATKFKPPALSVYGFALFYVANIYIFVILDDFYFLPV